MKGGGGVCIRVPEPGPSTTHLMSESGLDPEALRGIIARELMHPEIDPLYDAFEHPRSERPTLPLLPPAEARAYGHEVRGRVLDLLDRAPFSGTRLLGDGFAFGMIAQHEVQHDETMLITHQIRAGAP